MTFVEQEAVQQRGASLFVPRQGVDVPRGRGAVEINGQHGQPAGQHLRQRGHGLARQHAVGPAVQDERTHIAQRSQLLHGDVVRVYLAVHAKAAHLARHAGALLAAKV